jgi:RND family efflux transporter MFP subunit
MRQVLQNELRYRRGKGDWFIAGTAVFLMLIGAGCNAVANADGGAGQEGAKQEVAQPAAKAPSVKEVDAITLKAEPFTSRIETTGKALPVRESELSSEVPGKISKIFVKQGDLVKKGQVLMRFVQFGFGLGVQQAQAQRKATETQVRQLKLELDRVTRLVEKEAAPIAQLDQLKAQLEGAQAQSQMASVGVRQAQKALGDSVLRAPYAGMITDIMHEEGEFCPSMPQTMLVKIVDTSSLEVQAFLPEEVSSDVSVGQKVEVSVESARIKTEGEIIYVANRLDEETQTLEIKVRLANDDGKIKGGAFTRIGIVRRSLDNAILIPLKAISRGPDGQPFVFVAVDGAAKKVLVELGESSGSRILVRTGLADSQLLVTSQLSALEDGTLIKATTKAR